MDLIRSISVGLLLHLTRNRTTSLLIKKKMERTEKMSMAISVHLAFRATGRRLHKQDIIIMLDKAE